MYINFIQQRILLSLVGLLISIQSSAAEPEVVWYKLVVQNKRAVLYKCEKTDSADVISTKAFVNKPDCTAAETKLPSGKVNVLKTSCPLADGTSMIREYYRNEEDCKKEMKKFNTSPDDYK